MDPDLHAAVIRLRDRPGDEAAVREIDRALRPRLVRYFTRGPWPEHEAEDLVQKTLALVYSRVETLGQSDRFVGWLYAIARNVRHTAAGTWIERRRVEVPAEDPPPGVTPARDADALGGAMARERLDAVAAAIAELPSRQRQCLLLRVREELSYEEIGELLDVSPLTVRNHIAQAKESLRRTFDVARRTADDR
jgi:RNA polymerase sigma-70 factor (ECF subfamily)